jgi:hypothetical protein
MFTPPSAGNILTNAQTMGAMAPPQVNVQPPQVNVSVINVTDPAEVSAAIGSQDGERAIVNVIRKKRREIRNALG